MAYFYPPHPYSGQHFGCSPRSCWACKERRLQAIQPCNYFRRIQPMWSRYLNVTVRQTVRRTDYLP